MNNMEAEIETEDRIHPSNADPQTDDKTHDSSGDGLSLQVPNGPPAISRLLKEILFHIFIILRDDEYSLMDDDESWSRRARRCDWIAVSHVCSVWRAVGLGHPLLWNRIVNRLHDTWIMVFMQRSANAPLDVKVRLCRHGRHVVNSLTAQAGRWRRIDVDVGDEERLSLLLDELSKAPQAPYLESFCLRSRDLDHTTFTIVEQKIPTPFPRNAFSGYTPKLRHLELQRPLFPVPGSPMLSSLTSLNIMVERPELFVDIPMQFRSPFTTRPLRMNKLQTLILDVYDSEHLIDILHNVQLPSLQRLSYICSSPSGHISEAMLMALSTHVHAIQRNEGPIHLLSLSAFSWGTVAITGWTSAQMEDEAARAFNWRVEPFIPMAPGHGAFVHVQDEIYDDVFLCVKFSPMLRLLQLSSSSVRELRLNRVASATRAEWQAAFCSFGAVETLDYYQPFEQDLLPESCTVFEAATPDGTDGLFPRLRKVVYSFDRRLMHGGVSQPLWRLAESKKAAGSPLEVNFRDVGDYDAKIEATLGKIAKVTWGEQDTAG